jgi:hypothetical protein
MLGVLFEGGVGEGAAGDEPKVLGAGPVDGRFDQAFAGALAAEGPRSSWPTTDLAWFPASCPLSGGAGGRSKTRGTSLAGKVSSNASSSISS